MGERRLNVSLEVDKIKMKIIHLKRYGQLLPFLRNRSSRWSRAFDSAHILLQKLPFIRAWDRHMEDTDL